MNTPCVWHLCGWWVEDRARCVELAVTVLSKQSVSAVVSLIKDTAAVFHVIILSSSFFFLKFSCWRLTFFCSSCFCDLLAKTTPPRGLPNMYSLLSSASVSSCRRMIYETWWREELIRLITCTLQGDCPMTPIRLLSDCKSDYYSMRCSNQWVISGRVPYFRSGSWRSTILPRCQTCSNYLKRSSRCSVTFPRGVFLT